MKYTARRTLRLPAELDQRVAEYKNQLWADNARQLLQLGLLAHQADAIVKHEQLAYGERITFLTRSERLAQKLSQLLQTPEPIHLPTGDYLVLIEV